MKYAFVLLLAFLLFVSCASSPEQFSDSGVENREKATEVSKREVHEEREPEEAEPERLLEKWQKAVNREDLDRLMEYFWPNARLEVINSDGSSDTFMSPAAIREYHRKLFQEVDFKHVDLPQYRQVERPDPQLIVYELRSDWAEEHVAVRQREGRWKIEMHEIIFHRPGIWITSRIQVDADLNNNGFIDFEPEREHNALLEDILMPLLYDPHDVNNSADRLLDANEDGFIDKRELERARKLVFIEQILFQESHPYHHPDPIFDLNEDGRVREPELDRVLDFLFHEPALRQEREVKNQLDRKIDLNEDGYISSGEMEERKLQYFEQIAQLVFRDETVMEVPREVDNYLDDLADDNGDRIVDRKEQRILTESLKWEHGVESFIDWKLDENKNRHLDWHEILRARQTYALDRKAIEERAHPPFPVRTAIDEILDLDGSGSIEQNEIDEVVSLFVAEEPIRAPEWAAEFFDHDGNGELQPHEIEESKHFFIFPHPVEPDRWIDRELDRNGDGFVEPEEMGITAGISTMGETASFAERIESARWALERPEEEGEIAEREDPEKTEEREEEKSFESEFYKKLGTIQDKKLAIVGLSIGTKQVNQETANGLIVFVENAFVNIGKVRVVDRKNIEKIVEEYEFQSSALTDENTAVEIGKLSGADIIVIGSINFVGKMYYLNIKLINVETGEIIGSSIADAENESDFLNMSNKAVYNMF